MLFWDRCTPEKEKRASENTESACQLRTRMRQVVGVLSPKEDEVCMPVRGGGGGFASGKGVCGGDALGRISWDL